MGNHLGDTNISVILASQTALDSMDIYTAA